MNFGWLADQGADADLLSAAATAFSLGDQPTRVGVAVSGGSDSMAALHLMARVAPRMGWHLRAVTVDHRLRPEAAAEADFVARTCAALGVPHEVLVWKHGVIAGNLMDQARRARYALIAEWTRGHGVTHVALGHTADDQAETFLMGLAREAGLDGLAGMRGQWTDQGVKFHRPFLLHERAELRAYLMRDGLDWVDDPSNLDYRYTRVKARRALAALKPLGITVSKLGGVVHNLQMAQYALTMALWKAFFAIGEEVAGSVVLDEAGFRRLDPELARQLLITSLRWVSAAEHAPRADAVMRVRIAVNRGRNATLWGCRIVVVDNKVLIAREPRAVAGVACATDALWDGRWRLDGPHAPDLTVRALGAEGLRMCKDWRGTGLSREVLVVTPAVRRGDALVAAPLAGLANGWGATVAAGFGLSPVSH